MIPSPRQTRARYQNAQTRSFVPPGPPHHRAALQRFYRLWSRSLALFGLLFAPGMALAIPDPSYLAVVLAGPGRGTLGATDQTPPHWPAALADQTAPDLGWGDGRPQRPMARPSRLEVKVAPASVLPTDAADADVPTVLQGRVVFRLAPDNLGQGARASDPKPDRLQDSSGARSARPQIGGDAAFAQRLARIALVLDCLSDQPQTHALGDPKSRPCP